MDSYHQTHHFPGAPPPPPPPSASDPYYHHHHHQQSSLRPPVPPQGPWFHNQFQYHPSHSASPSPHPPPSQWGPPPAPHSEHAPPPPPPPPPGAYPPPPHPYPSQPMHHNQFPPPRPHMFQQLPPHSQEWNNPTWAPHQGWEYRAQGNEEDWAARARAWADAKTAMDSQQSQFAPTGRHEEHNYYQDQYSQPINSNHPDMSHQPPPTTYEQYPASATTVARPSAAHHLESTPVTISSEQSSYFSDGRLTYSVTDGSYGGNMSSVLHHQGKLSSSPSVHQQEVPSSNYSVTGKEDTVDQNIQSFKSLPLQSSSVHGGQQHFQSPIPPPYAYSNEPGPIGPMANLADQPLDFGPRFSHDRGLRMHSGFPRNDSAGSTRGNDSGVPMPSLNSWSSISPGMIYPPIPPVLASGAQLDPPVAVPSSVPGHTPSPFGRFAGSGITPAIPAAAAPFPGAALPATVLSGDAYGMSTMSERPKKASVPNWLREEIKKAVITSSSADHPKEDAELMEDQGVDKSYAKGDQADSKSIDSSRSTEEEDDEDVVEEARTAATNQEIKRVLTEVLLKVTDELFDEIATKVLDEDDLAVEAKLTSNQNVSSSPFPVSTPKASAKVLVPVKVQEPDNDDTSEKSSSSSPGDVLGLGNYASDDEENDDRDGEIQSSNMQGSKTMFNVELSSTKRNLRDIQDAVGSASTRGNVIEHSGNHVISDINDGPTSSVNEMSKSTGFSKLNDDWMDREMGQEHSLKPSSKGKDNETKFGDGIASGTRDVLGMVSEQQRKNVNGKNVSKDPHDGETKIKPLDSGKQESMRGSSLKDRVKEEGEVKTRTNEKADENRLKQDARRPRKEEADDQTVQKGKLKDQGVKSGEKGKDSDSRHRSTHQNSKDERREDKHLRVSTKDGTDRNRVYTKDDEGRTRQKISSELTRHKSSRDRNKDKAIDRSTNSSDDSDDSKRKVKSRKRDKSPSPIRSRRRYCNPKPLIHVCMFDKYRGHHIASTLSAGILPSLLLKPPGQGGQGLGLLQDGADDCQMIKRIRTNYTRLKTRVKMAIEAGLWSIWLSGLVLIALSLYATQSLPSLKDRFVKPKLRYRAFGDRRNPSVSIFSAPRSFTGNIGVRQSLAIRSWLALSPQITVVLFSQDLSVAAYARSISSRVYIDSDIDFTFLGTPYFHSMMARSQSFASDICAFVHPETILLPDFISTLNYAYKLDRDWLLVASSRNISYIPFYFDESKRHFPTEDKKSTRLQKELLNEHWRWSHCGGKELLAWNNQDIPLHSGVLPPFLYGRGIHNNWVINEAVASEFRFVFDASWTISSFYLQDPEQPSDNETRSWEYSGNYLLGSLYGSSFHPDAKYSSLVKLLKCNEQYILTNTTENATYLPKNQRILSLWNTQLLHFGKKKMKKPTACDHGFRSLNRLHDCSLEKRVSSSETLEFPFSLEFLLPLIADKNKTIVLTVAGYSYKDMLMSWVCRLRHLQIPNYLVCALDSDTYHFSVLQGLPVYRDPLAPTNISFNDCHFGTECFQRVTKVKSRMVLRILKLGPINLPRRLNSGFYFARSDGSTIAAMEKVVKHAATSGQSEQPSFYDTLCGEGGTNRKGSTKCLEPETNLTVHFLDRNLFPNGAYQELWKKKNIKTACRKKGCFVLHNNWISGRLKKLERQMFSGLWEYDTSTRMCKHNLQGKIW
ncbi:Beta-arabinofuranosyltransferase RAY1, partial [Cucurbita argyrosperma subsp. argyrosperma]